MAEGGETLTTHLYWGRTLIAQPLASLHLLHRPADHHPSGRLSLHNPRQPHRQQRRQQRHPQPRHRPLTTINVALRPPENPRCSVQHPTRQPPAVTTSVTTTTTTTTAGNNHIRCQTPTFDVVVDAAAATFTFFLLSLFGDESLTGCVWSRPLSQRAPSRCRPPLADSYNNHRRAVGPCARHAMVAMERVRKVEKEEGVTGCGCECLCRHNLFPSSSHAICC